MILRMESDDIQLHFPASVRQSTHLSISSNEKALPFEIFGYQ